MDMGPNGGYHFLDLGRQRLGAAAEMKQAHPGWNIYFHVADLDAALDRVRAHGGTIAIGPHDVPTGERIVIGMDPQGARFSLVAAGK